MYQNTFKCLIGKDTAKNLCDYVMCKNLRNT